MGRGTLYLVVLLNLQHDLVQGKETENTKRELQENQINHSAALQLQFRFASKRHLSNLTCVKLSNVQPDGSPLSRPPSKTSCEAKRCFGMGCDRVSSVEKSIIESAKYALGFVPNDCLTMSKKPGFLKIAAELYATVFQTGDLSPDIKHLVLAIAYHAAGDKFGLQMAISFCREAGIPESTVQKIISGEAIQEVSASEFAVLQAARHIAAAKSQDQTKFDYTNWGVSEAEMLELASVFSFQAFVGRWNDLIKPELQTTDNGSPLHFGLLESLAA